jgi:hypothetical protein
VKRLVALLVAVGLVAGAWYLRTNVIDDDGGDGPSAPSGEAPTLVCATEVRAACERLDDVRVTYEEPGVTLDRLAAGDDLGADGWLVSQPWPDMAAVATSEPIVRSPLVAITATAGPGCSPIDWSCLAEFATSGGNLAFGSSDTTGGLLSRAGVATGLLGEGFASNDFELEEFGTYPRIEETVADLTQGRSSDLAADIQRIRGAYDAVLVLGKDATDLRTGFASTIPTPEITADVVLAGRPNRFDADEIRDALLATGWLRFDDKALSATNGLPNPGVMVALRDLSR